MFLVLLLVVDVWQNGLLAFRWFKYIGPEPTSPERPGKWYVCFSLSRSSTKCLIREGEHNVHSWIAFGVVMGVGLINAFIVFIGRDSELSWQEGVFR